jgi:hypothetical protein
VLVSYLLFVKHYVLAYVNLPCCGIKDTVGFALFIITDEETRFGFESNFDLSSFGSLNNIKIQRFEGDQLLEYFHSKVDLDECMNLR